MKKPQFAQTALRWLEQGAAYTQGRDGQHPYLGFLPCARPLPRDWPMVLAKHGEALRRASDADFWASLGPPADSAENRTLLRRDPKVGLRCTTSGAQLTIFLSVL